MVNNYLNANIEKNHSNNFEHLFILLSYLYHQEGNTSFSPFVFHDLTLSFAPFHRLNNP